jgi:hypothetical protein
MRAPSRHRRPARRNEPSVPPPSSSGEQFIPSSRLRISSRGQYRDRPHRRTCMTRHPSVIPPGERPKPSPSHGYDPIIADVGVPRSCRARRARRHGGGVAPSEPGRPRIARIALVLRSGIAPARHSAKKFATNRMIEDRARLALRCYPNARAQGEIGHRRTG